MCWKSCVRIDFFLRKYTIWQLLKNILEITNTVFSKSLSNVHIIIHRLQDVFQQLPNAGFACIIKFQFLHKIFNTSLKKTVSTQSSLRSVENHAEEFKNYDDGNEISDRCGFTFCMNDVRWITTFTFETDLKTPVMMCRFESDLKTPAMFSLCVYFSLLL